jgi:hypothetical protein
VARDLLCLGHLLFTKGDAPGDMGLGIAPRTEPRRLHLDRGGDDEHAKGRGLAAEHLAGALDVDLEHQVLSRRRLGQRGAVEVVEDLGPLEEAARLDVGAEGVLVDEVVSVGVLAGPAGTRRPGTAQPELVVSTEQLAYECSLADAPRADDDYEQGS